ncbi:MAG: cbb3-type cytochrome c oxidase subunit 3 [Pseudomonadota bacterium]
MDTYSFLRELADSWVLLAMVIFYITACLWAFRPSARRANEEAAAIPFRHDDMADTLAQDIPAQDVEAK